MSSDLMIRPQYSGAQGDSRQVQGVVAKSLVESTSGGSELPRSGQPMPSPVADPVIDGADVTRVVENLASYAKNTSRELNFSIDQDTGRTVIKVIDAESQEVIRQIPSEEIMALARALTQETPSMGMLLEIKA